MQNSKFKNTYQEETGDKKSYGGQDADMSMRRTLRLTNTMTRQGVKGTHRLNTQTLMNRRGTGEEREEGGGQVW